METEKEKINIYEQIYEIVRKIPFGRVCTYGIISDYIGTCSPRMVGWAMHQSFYAKEYVPAHRVVNRNGELSGRIHFPTPTMMQELLEQEGIEIKENKIHDFVKLLWRPN